MVEVVVDPLTLRARTSGANVTGCVHLKVGERAFPEAQWQDFPVIIPGWWLAGMAQVAGGKTRTFEGRFMDGPYYFVVEAVNGKTAQFTLCEPGSSQAEAIDLETLRVSVAVAAATVAHTCRSRGWVNSDLESLEAATAKAAA